MKGQNILCLSQNFKNFRKLKQGRSIATPGEFPMNQTKTELSLKKVCMM
jgi:hypothetical protein